MRRREVLTKAFNRIMFGTIASVIINPFEVADPLTPLASTVTTRPTPIPPEGSASRRNAQDQYLMTYDWTDRLKRQWRLKFSVDRSVYTTAAKQSHGYLSAFEDAKTSRIARQLTERLPATKLRQNIMGPLSERARLECAIGFVHSLGYMIDPDSKGVPEYHRTVAETLVDGGGDCKDLTYLLVGILSQEPFEYRTAMVFLPEHMLVGVRKADLPATYADAPTLPGGRYVAIDSSSSQPVGTFDDKPVLAIYNDGFNYLDRAAIVDTTGEFLRDPTDFQIVSNLR